VENEQLISNIEKLKSLRVIDKNVADTMDRVEQMQGF